MHVIAAKAVAFGEALRPEFKDYMRQVRANADALADQLIKGGLDIVTGKELDVQVYLEEKIENLDVVTVTAGNKREAINQLAAVSTRTFSIEEASRFSGTFNDPARMAQNFAGVSGSSDDRNDIIIRGNSPTGVLWRLEGADIPSPNHFSTMGSTGGPISMLNVNNLKNSEFMTGAWASEYGNALSGVFDSKFRVGNHEKREHSFSIGVLGLDATVEGPFSENYKGSYLVNFRYSSLDLLDKTGVIDFDGVPKYYDGSFKLNLPTASAGNFVAFGLLGRSSIKQESGTSDENGENEVITEKTNFNAGMSVFGLKHFYNLNKMIKMNYKG